MVIALDRPARSALLRRFWSVHRMGPAKFNDSPGRTLNECIAALEACKDAPPENPAQKTVPFVGRC
jgi:hypothetical protein